MTSSPAMDAAASLIADLVAQGVRDIVVSPGSRSQALALAAVRAADDGHVRVHVRIDERVAGFTALGIARETRVPAAVVCTSGTAVANLLPAVMEAFHSGVPMLLLTADRPPELRGSAPTRRRSRTVCSTPWVRDELDAPVPGDGEWTGLAEQAVAAAMGAREVESGPPWHRRTSASESSVQRAPLGRSALHRRPQGERRRGAARRTLRARPRAAHRRDRGRRRRSRCRRARALRGLAADRRDRERCAVRAAGRARLPSPAGPGGSRRRIERVVVLGHPTPQPRGRVAPLPSRRGCGGGAPRRRGAQPQPPHARGRRRHRRPRRRRPHLARRVDAGVPPRRSSI